LKDLGTNTPFLSHVAIHPWAEALGWILKTKWCICPGSIPNRAGTLSNPTERWAKG
jgi:hypothetical protein